MTFASYHKINHYVATPDSTHLYITSIVDMKAIDDRCKHRQSRVQGTDVKEIHGKQMA